LVKATGTDKYQVNSEKLSAEEEEAMASSILTRIEGVSRNPEATRIDSSCGGVLGEGFKAGSKGRSFVLTELLYRFAYQLKEINNQKGTSYLFFFFNMRV
jgi:hypothetical protein